MHCNPGRLQQSLDEQLTEAQDAALAKHLAACAQCQVELDRLAASQHEWVQVGLALKQALNSGHLNGDAPLQPMGVESVADDHVDDLSADFAVDFLEPSESPEAVGKLGDIDILKVAGRGGMGVVLKGFQSELKRLVAVKVMAPHLAISSPARRRFAREAQAAAAILHPNVMPIFTVHSGGKLPYLVMPFLACESLEQRIAREGPLALVDLLRIGLQTAQGLAAAHAQGIVHRDVKPANILLEWGVDRVMLTDFGLARAIDDASLTRTGLIAGTPQYMSPEQVRDEPLDGRSDLFSLGSVLYAMATGRPPFLAETSFGVLRRITDADPRPIGELNPDLPDWLAAIIERLLAKSPADRLSSAQAVALMLEQCLAHVRQPTITPLPEFCRPRPRRRWLTLPRLLVAGLVATTLIGIGLWTGSTTPPTSNARPAASPAAAEAEPARVLQAPMPGAEAGQARDDNGPKIELVWCPPGIVVMGDIEPPAVTPAEIERAKHLRAALFYRNENERVETVHAILTRGYWLGKCEVTQAEWKYVMLSEPWSADAKTIKGADFPAAPVSWDDAMSFCHKLTAEEREAGRLPANWEYTLPTEAQWERACRARTDTSFSFGDDLSVIGEYAWYRGNASEGGQDFAHRVAQKKPNPWGFFDMHGNVWEWCRDGFEEQLPSGRDPLGKTADNVHVGRGGAYLAGPPRCRSAARGKVGDDWQRLPIGFRVALALVRPDDKPAATVRVP